MWSPEQEWETEGEAAPPELEPGSSGSSCSGSSRSHYSVAPDSCPWRQRVRPLRPGHAQASLGTPLHAAAHRACSLHAIRAPARPLQCLPVQLCSRRAGCHSLCACACVWCVQAEMVATRSGPIRVTVCGEASCPALVTYHDIGLNRELPPSAPAPPATPASPAVDALMLRASGSAGGLALPLP